MASDARIEASYVIVLESYFYISFLLLHSFIQLYVFDSSATDYRAEYRTAYSWPAVQGEAPSSGASGSCDSGGECLVPTTINSTNRSMSMSHVHGMCMYKHCLIRVYRFNRKYRKRTPSHTRTQQTLRLWCKDQPAGVKGLVRPAKRRGDWDGRTEIPMDESCRRSARAAQCCFRSTEAAKHAHGS